MATRPPPSFVDLATAYSQKDTALSVMGVVVDHLPAAKSAGTDHVITFTIQDPSWVNGLGLKVRYFHREMERLPAIEKNGDVVLLRNIKIKPYKGTSTGISNTSTSCAILPEALLPTNPAQLPAEGIKAKTSPSAPSPTRLEIEYAIYLCNSKRGNCLAPPPAPTCLQLTSTAEAAGGAPAKRKKKFSLLQDLSLPEDQARNVFADLLGEVRKIYENDFCVELSITDYTKNEALYNYPYGCNDHGTQGDEFGYMARKEGAWPGPWGKMTMNVRLWDAHASFARDEVKLGSFVFLRNVQIGTGRDGGYSMEGKLRGDRNDPERVGVEIYRPRDADRDENMKELLGRKRVYEIKAKSEHKEFIRDASMISKKRLTLEQEPSDSGLSKKKSKSQRKKERKAAQTAARLGTIDVKGGKKLESNAHVRCQKMDVPLKSIDEIMDPEILGRKTPSGNDFYLPFQNCCYHAKVRVVDFLPNDLAHFAVPYRASDYAVLSDHEESEDSDVEMDDDGDVTWQWRFYLVVEDATSPATIGYERIQMPLLVADQDGEGLLDMEASDLTRDPKKLAQVREKLFVLWGDLQEQKEAKEVSNSLMDIKPSAKPFECLIKEYGIPARDEDGHTKGRLEFDRMFRLWGATVK